MLVCNSYQFFSLLCISHWYWNWLKRPLVFRFRLEKDDRLEEQETCWSKKQVSTSYRAQWKFLGELAFCLANPDFLSKLSFLSSSSWWWWKVVWAICWFSIPPHQRWPTKWTRGKTKRQRWEDNIIVIKFVIIITVMILIIIITILLTSSYLANY